MSADKFLCCYINRLHSFIIDTALAIAALTDFNIILTLPLQTKLRKLVNILFSWLFSNP